MRSEQYKGEVELGDQLALASSDEEEDFDEVAAKNRSIHLNITDKSQLTHEGAHSPAHLEETRKALPCKLVSLALFLLFAGIACLVYGFYEFSIDGEKASALLIVGAICIMPGSYQTYKIIKYLRDPNDVRNEFDGLEDVAV